MTKLLISYKTSKLSDFLHLAKLIVSGVINLNRFSYFPSTTAISLLIYSEPNGRTSLNYFLDLCFAMYIFIFVKTLLAEELKKFLIELSVFPGKNAAI